MKNINILYIFILLSACGKSIETITVDGSSTVYPISEAVAEEWNKNNKELKITVGISGTGGGFKKLCSGETHLIGASRPINNDELNRCKENNIDPVEFSVAYDGIVIAINPENYWASTLKISDLKKMWAPSSQNTVNKWSDIKEEWPNEELHLFGPGVDSGTYDYFTQAIVGKEHSSRGDFTSSEDDNVIVQGVVGDKLSLGFFGFAYYVENKDRLKAVYIDDEKEENGTDAVYPTFDNILNGKYQPLSRPVFIYVSKSQLEKQEFKSFVEFYLNSSQQLSKEVGYIPVGDKEQSLSKNKLTSK